MFIINIDFVVWFMSFKMLLLLSRVLSTNEAVFYAFYNIKGIFEIYFFMEINFYDLHDVIITQHGTGN